MSKNTTFDVLEMARDSFEKRQLVRDHRRALIHAKADVILTKLNRAEKENNAKAVQKWKLEFCKCSRGIDLIDLAQERDWLQVAEVELGVLNAQIASTRNLKDKVYLMKEAELKENDVFEQHIRIKQMERDLGISRKVVSDKKKVALRQKSTTR